MYLFKSRKKLKYDDESDIVDVFLSLFWIKNESNWFKRKINSYLRKNKNNKDNLFIIYFFIKCHKID